MTQNQTCCAELEGWLSPVLFKALSDPNRIALLVALAESRREQTVSEIAKTCSVDLSVVSRHLKTLRDAGVLQAEKRGKQVFYSVRISGLVIALRGLADALEACCPPGGR